MEEVLKIAANGQWSLEKARSLTPEEHAAFKAKRDEYMRQKHGMPSKEEHEKQLEHTRGRNVPKSTTPDYSRHAEQKYKEGYRQSTREVSPGKFVHQGTPKPPPKDVVLPKSSPNRPGGFKSFERSPVRMSPKVGKK